CSSPRRDGRCSSTPARRRRWPTSAIECSSCARAGSWPNSRGRSQTPRRSSRLPSESMSTTELPFRRRSAWQHFSIQSAPLLLALLILAGTLVAYIALFQAKLGRTPGSFEWTTVTNSALPLVFAAVGQTIVVVTRGLDLSV